MPNHSILHRPGSSKQDPRILTKPILIKLILMKPILIKRIVMKPTGDEMRSLQ